MRKSILNILKPAVVLILLGACIWLTSYVLRRNESFEKNHDFYSDTESCDVFFLGSSHTVMGVLPMELWNEYGITSYNLANNGQWCAGDYWVLKNALDQKTPNLVVLDAYAVFADEKYAEGHMDYLHESFDAIPLSKNKIDAVLDMFPEENQMEFIVPFATYHNRWESVDSTFFQREDSYQKGAYENASTKRPVAIPAEQIPLIPTSQANTTETISKEYLRKSIELCQEKNIPVLLMVTPFNAEEDLQEWVNSVYGIAEEYDVPFINGLQENIINTYTDLWDDGHLNSSGARKWTSFMGDYITANYDISDKRDDAAFASWNEDYVNYRHYELAQLGETESLHYFVMQLYNEGFNFSIAVNENSDLYKDDFFRSLLENAGDIKMPDAPADGQLCIVDRGLDNRAEYAANSALNSVNTSYGTLSYVPADNFGHQLVLSGANEIYCPLSSETPWDVQIVVWDSTTGNAIAYSWVRSADGYTRITGM